MATTALAPTTRHLVVCGLCAAEAVCPSELLVRDVVTNPYFGTEVIEASIALALPKGWVLRDFISEVCFVCPHCSLDQTP